MYSQKRNCAASVPLSTFMYLWSIYIFPCWVFGPPISCSRIGRPIVGIYKSLSKTWMQELGLWPRSSFSGNIFFEFSELCLCSVYTFNFYREREHVTSFRVSLCSLRSSKLLSRCSNFLQAILFITKSDPNKHKFFFT